MKRFKVVSVNSQRFGPFSCSPHQWDDGTGHTKLLVRRGSQVLSISIKLQPIQAMLGKSQTLEHASTTSGAAVYRRPSRDLHALARVMPPLPEAVAEATE